MPSDPEPRRSRRAILAAAAGGAAGVLAARLGTPDAADATATALLTETTNTTSATTWVAGASGSNFEVLRVNSPGTSPALQAESVGGTGVVGASSGAGFGVVGFAQSGYGVGAISLSGTGLYATTELGVPPVQPGVAILAHVTDKTRTGIRAEGRVVFPDRSGRAIIAKGAASVTVPKAGVKPGNIAVATLAAARPGFWVSSVVCGTGRITIRLNKALTAGTPVSWIVLG